ncbi:MAG: gluconate 2-dehydrogenase subunit 3 family protein [Vicinamibacterales bacterium]
MSQQEPPETTKRHGNRGFSRRELLRRAGIAGAVAAIPAEVLGRAVASMPGAVPTTVQQASTTPRREALETLTSAESETLEAIVARLIPSDASGPGAAEARAAHYIDHALAGPLASTREAYAAGLAALNAYAQTSKGAPFARLSPADQDAVLMDVEQKNVATGFSAGSAAFFGLVRAHTIQGTFCDPYYGGNANFVGWDLIGYPGVRTSVTADQQRTDIVVKPNHRSAYDYDMFGRRSGASPGAPRDQQHGR